MYLHQFGIQIGEYDRPLRTRDITPAGLHGLLYDVMERLDPRAATWLHDYVPPNWSSTYSPPKPYTMAESYYDPKRRQLAGLLISTLTDEAHELIFSAFRKVFENQNVLQLGKQNCLVENLFFYDNTSFEHLSQAPPIKRVGLQVLTPAAFKQGHGELLFPLPRNVFQRPYHVWNAYAPDSHQLPDDWLDWCEATVFALRHDVKTVQKNINYQRKFAGFVGEVWFGVRRHKSAEKQHTDKYNSILHSLARFTNYCGIGMRTTMGMGAVSLLRK